ncbi:hypothetical protein AXG93_1847s1410 [Marchantia polymorpha subsp. ruderalis]|uniref:Uncharacterized protein n=1 Tax=Marchantia polymorpha subsp. ruderalis TaxID=1480154 RepID=A0A176VFE8_MARPO|nr:hypothetical protein AXG93_1847s1410 [Marchantia polymorpha subsp. ruderalis]
MAEKVVEKDVDKVVDVGEAANEQPSEETSAEAESSVTVADTPLLPPEEVETYEVVENTVPRQWRGDSRVEWLREKVCISLDVTRPVFDSVFSEENGAQSIETFLDKAHSCIFFYSDSRTIKVITKTPIFVEFTPEEIAKRKQAAAAAKVAAAAAAVAAAAAAAETGAEVPPVVPPETPEPDPEEEKGVWETQDVESMNTVQVVCATTGRLSNEAINKAVVYFINIFPQLGMLDFGKMHKNLEFGVLPSGPTLSALEQLLFHLFMPILAREGVYAGSKFWHTEETHMMEHVGNELLSNMQRFLSQVSIAQQHLLGDAQLVIPSLPADCLEKTDIDYELILQLESLLADWIPAVIHAIETEAVKIPAGQSPLAETQFWRDRTNALSSLYEQLNSINAKRMLALLDAGSSNSNLLASFRSQFTELSKMFLEAKENVKFLTTLERHFKTICTGPLPRVLETIGPMMNALRMVWIISGYYSDDTNMGSLFERIAFQIAVKVTEESDFKTIFKVKAEEAAAKISTGKLVLDAWSGIYLQVREQIESSGRDPRWEFDRKKLFERTNYMSTVCVDLLHIVEVVNDFLYFLGPELKAVTGDVQGIDEVIHKVQAMVDPIENLPFDAFDKAHAPMWSAAVLSFDKDKERVEQLTKAFIDSSFKKLRSAEGALELLQSFKTVKSEGAINKQMMEKFNDILTQFIKEIDYMREIFRSNMDSPPTTRNQPPVAGSINWARSLFGRVRKTMHSFKTRASDMLQHAAAVEMDIQYRGLAKQMLIFEKQWVMQWLQTVNQQTTFYLKQSIIRNETGARIEVNFHIQLSQIIRETKYLDAMGFQVPEFPLSVTLQSDSYQSNVESLQNMLEHYQSVINMMTPIEAKLLGARVKKLQHVLDPGFLHLNWNALGIPDFVTNCTKAINAFKALISQVQSNAANMENAIAGIARSKLVGISPNNEDSEILDMLEFYENFEYERQLVVDGALKQYRGIPPLLKKVEDVVVGTNTGTSLVFAEYYTFWELKIFKALNEMVLKSMNGLQTLFRDSLLRKGSTGKRNHTRLFRVVCFLNHPDVVVQPSLTETTKMLANMVRSILDSVRPFVRWMDGTCLETPPQSAGEDEQPYIYSFYSEVSVNPKIIKAMFTLNSSIQKASAGIYKAFGLVVAADVLEVPRDKSVEFLQISSNQLVSSVHSEASAWVTAIGEAMILSEKERVLSLHAKIDNWSKILHQPPDTLENLKMVLNVVGEILTAGMVMELEYLDLEERTRTRDLYKITNSDEDRARTFTIRTRWDELEHEARVLSSTLQIVKKNFVAGTQKQAEDFVLDTVSFRDRMMARGPVKCTDLDEGVQLLTQYQEELETMLKTKDALVLAQKLFDMPVTPYPALFEVETSLKNAALIYDIYIEFSKTVESYSGMLWAELDINKLVSITDEFSIRMKRLKRLKTQIPYINLEAKLKGFQDSLPLIQDLKSEALRKRHWDKLMKETGKSFDMDPKTFTLASIFRMELHNFAEVISDITNAAIKELNIETELRNLGETWKVQQFDVFKYTKDGMDRGWVLRSTEQTTVLLEEMMMNLQGMSSSRYVRPFLDEVSSWEQKLSLVGEVIDIWMQVQRKWMYLESIFVGSDDIRHQLPEEAKRFDTIDKNWIKIMAETAKSPNILEACGSDGRLDTLKMLYNQLENCQKSLSEYLDSKRNAFPRFFFISDDELLSVLGTSDPTSIQEHMLKLFDNCAALTFGEKAKTVNGMKSSEAETFAFRMKVSTEMAVEIWMKSVESEMRNTLFDIMKEGVYNYAKSRRVDWIYENLGMVTLKLESTTPPSFLQQALTGLQQAGSTIWWTWEVEDAFRCVRLGDKNAMKTFSLKLTRQLTELVGMVRSDLSSLQRKKVNALIIIEVHARDIIDTFVRDSILDHREFAWESQLRFYWDRKEDDTLIRQCTGEFKYGYEYMGLNGRLVITALTDRCYMTLTTALTYRLGGAPAGPAGTGKTETTKDLAKSMALLCVVFNCGDGLDYKV